MKKGIIFDLDGTLWDSSRSVVASWNEKLRQIEDIECQITIEQMHGYMGRTMTEIAYECFNMVSKERALEILDEVTVYENEYIRKHGGTLFEGLIDVLTLLKKDYFLAIVSNCQIGYIEAFIEYYKLQDIFDDTESFGNTMKDKDYNIRLVVERNHLDKAVYVGDIMGDYNSTMKAGLPFIHAAYGFGTVPENTPFIKDIRELPEVVRTII